MDITQEAANLSDEELFEICITAIDNMLECDRLADDMAAMLRAVLDEARRRGLIVRALH